jgi:hypothetical protein
MEEQHITWSTLLDIAPDSIADIQTCDGIYEKYRSWAKLSADDEALLRPLGRLLPDSLEPATTMETHEGSSYWSPEDAIALAYYPYNGCHVFQKTGCESYYLVYTEWGGHAPEKRARLILKNLITAHTA